MTEQITFMSLVKDSFIIRGIVAIALTFTVCYLFIVQLPVPSLLEYAWLLFLGYYAGVVQRRVTK